MTLGVSERRARLWFCCALLGFGVGVGVDGVNFWQPGVNLCQVLVSVGVEGAAAVLWGERHGVALLF